MKLLKRGETLAHRVLDDPAVRQILRSTVFKPSLKVQLDRVCEDNQLFGAFCDGLIRGTHKAAIITGDPGIGKSHQVRAALKRAGLQEHTNFRVMRGMSSAGGLYACLMAMSAPGQILVIDDCDTLLKDETALNILKGATDRKDPVVRWDSLRNNLKVRGQEGYTALPDHFRFDGQVIIITNVGMNGHKKGRMADHFRALKDRCAMYEISANSNVERFSRMFVAITQDQLVREWLTDKQEAQLLEFIYRKLPDVKRLSLRTAEMIAREIRLTPNTWEKMAERHLQCR